MREGDVSGVKLVGGYESVSCNTEVRVEYRGLGKLTGEPLGVRRGEGIEPLDPPDEPEGPEERGCWPGRWGRR